MSEQPDTPKLKTYVYGKAQSFFVSTIDRSCSSIHGGRYLETIVWDWCPETGDKGEMWMLSAGGVRGHMEAVKSLMLGVLPQDLEIEDE